MDPTLGLATEVSLQVHVCLSHYHHRYNEVNQHKPLDSTAPTLKYVNDWYFGVTKFFTNGPISAIACCLTCVIELLYDRSGILLICSTVSQRLPSCYCCNGCSCIIYQCISNVPCWTWYNNNHRLLLIYNGTMRICWIAASMR